MKTAPWGLVAALPPDSEAVRGREKPGHWSRPDKWSAWRCFRGIGVGGFDGKIIVGLGMASEPLDEAITVVFECATLDLASARRLHERLGVAITQAAGETS